MPECHCDSFIPLCPVLAVGHTEGTSRPSSAPSRLWHNITYQHDLSLQLTLLNAAALCRKLRQLSAPATCGGSACGGGAAVGVSPGGRRGGKQR